MKMKEAKIIENMVNVGKIALTVAIASLAVAGCGYDSANDSVAPTAASANTVDISAMMNTALSGLAAGNRVASVGDGCVAELTIDTALQRKATLCAYRRRGSKACFSVDSRLFMTYCPRVTELARRDNISFRLFCCLCF